MNCSPGQMSPVHALGGVQGVAWSLRLELGGWTRYFGQGWFGRQGQPAKYSL